MGHLILYTENGPEILGDERDQQQAKKFLGLPYNKPNGEHVSQSELDKRDKDGR